jgi:methyl-accepting chemotaxis protein
LREKKDALDQNIQKREEKMLQRFKLSTRIMLMGVMIVVCFSLVFAWITPRIKGNLYDAKYEKTKHVVESVWGILDYYGKQAKAKAMPVEEAKKRAVEAVKGLRYDKDEYFWINDTEPRMVMHPIKPEMDGTSLAENKDPHGKRLFVAFVDVCRKNGEGFVDYMWPKPGSPKPEPKISFVKLYPEWGWIVGSGVYLDDVGKEVSLILYMIFGAAGAIGAGSLFLAYWMARSISRPITRIIEGLNDGAEQMSSGSTQVASASQSLAEGASEQAAGLEETSSSIEEMASMTKNNAENAGQANTLMIDTGKVVEGANQAMGELNKSMNEISLASEETSKIIKTIDEIAFQTNLLALNAAVEAARAGEAGAGFAVVADEVRNLAMRAAEAAKNTANLIEGTVKKVKNGSEIVTRTNEAFVRVVQGSKKVEGLVAEISAASQEQAQGVIQINKAMAEMDKVTQQNAANAEESAAAAEEMSAQAEQMRAYVQEMNTLVKGKSNGTSVAAGLQLAEEKRSPKPGKTQQLKNGLQKMLKSPESKGEQGKKPVKAAKEVKPSQVIPLEEGDFKEF